MNYETLEFNSPTEFRDWLTAHGKTTEGIWLKIYKKASGISTVTYAQALDEALCFGWIDGQRKSNDEVSFLQKFTPRRAKSIWSKRNIEHIERLTTAGLMTDAGLHEVTRAQADGRWAAAYDAPSTMQVPDYFLAKLHENPQATAFFNSLNKTSKYTIAWQLQTAKTDATRLKRTDAFIAMLAAEQKPR